MDIEAEIQQCKESMSQLWRIVKGLQESGLDPKDTLFDDLADKTWKHMFRWECLVQLDPNQAFMSYHKFLENEMIIPAKYLQEFKLIRFQGLNPNDHFHWQN